MIRPYIQIQSDLSSHGVGGIDISHLKDPIGGTANGVPFVSIYFFDFRYFLQEKRVYKVLAS
jgi:hypothetical protein